MDKELRTKIKLYGLFGLIISWRTWGHFNSSIKFSDQYLGHFPIIRISITILILVTAMFMLTRRNQIARGTLQVIFGLFTVTTVVSFFMTPIEIFSTLDFVRQGLILVLYGYGFYFLQSRDMSDYLKTKQQGTVEN